MRLIKHEESYEVRYDDGTPSCYFYFDDNAGRRAVSGRVSSKEAELAAKTFARTERDKTKKPADP